MAAWRLGCRAAEAQLGGDRVRSGSVVSGQLEQLVLHAHEFAVHVEENMICKNYFFMHLYFAISDPFVFVNRN